jgi:hypothetical protein
MKITEDIITAHKNLSNYSVKFLEFVQKNPESLERWNFRWLRREDKQRALQPWPTFISNSRINEIKEESIKISNIIKSIPQRIFANDPGKMSEYYNIPRENIGVYPAQIYEKALRVLNLKGKAVFCKYEQLEIIDNHLFFGDLKIHILLEQYHGVLSPDIMEVFKRGNICLYNGPITNLLSNKLNLALLSDLQDTDIFTHQERELIKKYIPWTRKITSGDIGFGQDKRKGEDFLRLNREKLVLKFPGGVGGEGIFIGNKTPPDQWRQLTAHAIKQGNWLIQEYIESQPYLYQCGEKGCAVHDMVLGVFIVGDVHAGQWARILPKVDSKGIVNCARGAEDSIVFEVEE